MAEKTPLRARASCQPSSKTEAPKTAPRKARRMTAQATPRQAKRGAPAHSKFIFSIVLLHLLYLNQGHFEVLGIPKIAFYVLLGDPVFASEWSFPCQIISRSQLAGSESDFLCKSLVLQMRYTTKQGR